MAKVVLGCEIYVRRIKFSGFYAPKITSFSKMKKGFNKKLISTSLVEAFVSPIRTKEIGCFYSDSLDDSFG